MKARPGDVLVAGIVALSPLSMTVGTLVARPLAKLALLFARYVVCGVLCDDSPGESIMAQAEETTITRRCPRCGGLMKKLHGSSLYWHADNNHPRCDITNIVDTPMTVQASDEPLEQPDQPPRGKNRKK